MISKMDITYLGHSCFKIKGKNTTIVTDPYDAYIGFKMPKISADIVTVSHDHKDHNFIEGVSGDPFVISGPGEYEVAGVDIWGVFTFHDSVEGAKRGENTVYQIALDGLKIVHLGDLGHKLTSEQVDELNGVDILLVPVGGFYTIGAKRAAEVINQLQPTMVIPMHFRDKKHDLELFGKVEELDAFLKEMGAENVKRQKKYKIKGRSELPEETSVVVLERSC
jgi:L-ascorbate metabolism protein UlaG (beta-lactamase superfamily)